MGAPSARAASAAGLRAIGALLAQLLYWSPVWVPLGLFAQVAILGLKPARAEAERLEAEERVVLERHRRAREGYERMRAEAEAWEDEVYRERRRRLREAGAR